MSRRPLRRMPRVSYFEPEEPAADKYIYCERCYDFVYEYCSVHGALPRVPDDTVPLQHGFPSCVPRAALTIPRVFLHINYSCIPEAGLGVFATLTLPRGVRFGPYRGAATDEVTSTYCWQIYSRDNKPKHVVDAADPNNSNWMRYVNCARHWSEQNLVAYQYQGQVYYRTIKIIPRFTELLVFYGTEFANNLNIDLSAYNKPTAKLKYAVPNIRKRKIESENINRHPVKINQNTFDNNKENHPQNVTQLSYISDDNKTSINNIHIQEKNLEKNSTETVNVNDINESDSHTVAVKTGDITNNLTIEKPEDLKITKKGDIIDIRNLYYYCDTCNYQSVTKACLQKHVRLHDTKRKFACETCGYRFQKNDKLNIHRATHKMGISDRKEQKCNICDFTTHYSGVLKKHLLRHAGLKPHTCHVCDKKFMEAYRLKRHLLIHTGDKPYKCDVCNYEYADIGSLRRHKRTHIDQKLYSCNVCSYKCNEAGYLKIHKRSHTGEKPYACDLCDNTFSRANHLKRHKRIHNSEKPYACDVCSYKCNEAGHLKIHKRSHTGEKPYACDLCNNKFTRAGNLKIHKRSHTGEKPYACDLCNNKFTRAGNLKIHKRSHTGEKPYACDLCNNKFTRAGNLKIHKRSHTGEKPYACDVCSYKCISAGSLMKHKRTHLARK